MYKKFSGIVCFIIHFVHEGVGCSILKLLNGCENINFPIPSPFNFPAGKYLCVLVALREDFIYMLKTFALALTCRGLTDLAAFGLRFLTCPFRASTCNDQNSRDAAPG
jgi:hypothetical protein